MKNYSFHDGILKVWTPVENEVQIAELTHKDCEALIEALQAYLNRPISLEEMFRACSSNPSPQNHEKLCLMIGLNGDNMDNIGCDIELPYDFDLCYDLKTLNDLLRVIYYGYDLQGVCSMVLYYKLVYLFEEKI